MASEPFIQRSLLRFAEEVQTRFAFLETLGFRSTRSEVTLVRFESSNLVIIVYHEKLSYEISSAIESARGSDSYSFYEVLCLVNGARTEQYRDYATHTVEGVAEGVRQLAELCRKCIDAGIFSDSELFSRLRLQREKWASEYALEIQLEQAQKDSEAAWKENDLAQVVRVLAPLQEHLSLSNLRKLEYAKKHSND